MKQANLSGIYGMIWGIIGLLSIFQGKVLEGGIYFLIHAIFIAVFLILWGRNK